jgi:hypothetical protein
MSKTMTKKVRTARDFEKLPEAEKEAYIAEIDAETPEQRLARSRPLNARERAQWRATKNKMGRPKFGKNGTKIVSVTVEKGLLKQADAYARQKGLKRSELFSLSVKNMLSTTRD